MSAPDALFLSLRELRMVFERLAQAAGAPPGLLPTTRDAAVASAAMRSGGLAGIGHQMRLLRGSRPGPLRVVSEAPDLVIDAAGQHAWFVADALLDAAVEMFRREGVGRLLATNVAEPGELRVASVCAERHGLAAEVEARVDGAVALLVAPRPSDAQNLFDRLRRDGLAAKASDWWPLYHASHEALAPDSFESRRHAGTVRVEADGRVVGRNDEDESDLSMLIADPARLRHGPASSLS